MLNKNNWQETKTNFTKWWNGEDAGRPLMYLIARDDACEFDDSKYSVADKYTSAELAVERFYHDARRSNFLCESYPQLSINIGPGSYACYLGSDPVFTPETCWYKTCIEDYESFGDIVYNKDEHWLNLHLAAIQKAVNMVGDDGIVCVPDIVENIDILAAMRGTQKLLYDMIDYPDTVTKHINSIDSHYFDVYDRFYDIVKGENGSASFTAFNVWGEGKTAKVQCDFCAMISPRHFRQYVQPTLREQCARLDYSIYHLDGPDCVCHIPALMEIENLNALQWTAGAGQPDGANKKWYNIYRQVSDAGKSLWVSISDGDINDWIESADNFVKEFGRKGLYFQFPTMTNRQAEALQEFSYKNWE